MVIWVFLDAGFHVDLGLDGGLDKPL